MRSSTSFAWIAMVALLCFGASIAQGEDKPVKLTREWKGSVADASLANNTPTCIASAKRFEKLWLDWKLGPAGVPDVDFAKQIVVVATSPGSHISLSCLLNDTGDLKVLGMATLDFGEGFRYVIGTVSRDGVKTVDGKELPKE